VDEFHRGTSLGRVSLLKLPDGFSAHDDKRPTSRFPPCNFVPCLLPVLPLSCDSALVLGALDAVKSVVEEPKGLPLTF